MKKVLFGLLCILLSADNANAQVLHLETDTFKIGPTDGLLTIKASTETFAKVDEDFNKFGTKVVATPAISIKKYSLTKESTLSEMFESLGKLDELTFTENQICEIAHKYKVSLKENNFNFFLIKSGGSYYVATITCVGDGIKITPHRIDGIGKYNAGPQVGIYVPVRNNATSFQKPPQGGFFY